MTERRKNPEIVKDGIVERRKITRNLKKRNDGKSPETLKDGTIQYNLKASRLRGAVWKEKTKCKLQIQS